MTLDEHPVLHERGSLAAWLEFNVAFVQAEAPQVRAGDDLVPTAAAIKDGKVMAAHLPWRSIGEKSAMVAWFRAWLHGVEADCYALISMAWGISASPAEAAEAQRVIGTHGSTGTKYEAGRQEMITVAVGDRSGSLFCCLNVERDWKGKIRKLHRQPTRSSLDPGIGMYGQMIDLLLDPTVH